MEKRKETWALFDLDGTLTQSEEGIWNGFRYVAARMNLPEPDAGTLRKVIGPPLLYSFREYLGMTEEEALKAQDIYRERYTTVGLFENRVYPGIRTVLRILRKQGVHMALVSGKPEGSSRRILEHFGLMPFFERVCCATDGHADKEALIRSALPETDVSAWMIGDRKFDMDGAVRAGVRALGVTYGYGSEEELLASGAEFLAHSPREIADILCPGARPPKGVFLAMEGLDGCGKGTQMERLTDTLTRYGFELRLSREPGGSPIGEKVRTLLLDPENAAMTPETEACLHAASRAQHVREVIRPALQNGEVLLCDRYLDSSVAYQGGGRRLGVKRVLEINETATEGTLPRWTVFLRLDHRTSLERRLAQREPDRMEQEKEDFFVRVEEAYQELIASDPDRYIVVDASRSREEVAETVAGEILTRLMALEDEDE